MSPSFLIYVDTGNRFGDKDHLRVCANEDTLDRHFTEHDPKGGRYIEKRGEPLSTTQKTKRG